MAHNQNHFNFNLCVYYRGLLNDVSSDEDEDEKADSIDMFPVTIDNAEFVCGDGEHEELYPLSAFRNDMDKMRKKKTSAFLKKGGLEEEEEEEECGSSSSSDDDEMQR
jgi:hypothetical protein